MKASALRPTIAIVTVRKDLNIERTGISKAEQLASSRREPVLGKKGAATSPAELLEKREPGGITRLTLNRPHAYNGLTHSLLQLLVDKLEEITDDDAVRVVVLEGAGEHFCGGADHKALADSASVQNTDAFYRLLARAMVAISHMRQPVIARVGGLAASEGCQIVAGCDLAVAARSAKFALPDINAGLACALPMVALARVIGPKRTMDMALAGTVLDAEEALSTGLVGRLAFDYELDKVCLDLARHISSLPRAAVAGTKEALVKQSDASLTQAYADACQIMTRYSKQSTNAKKPSPIQARRLGD
ncbi:MAG: enoyl-CoA hydratase-related protein [Pseudomonadota bacterium]